MTSSISAVDENVLRSFDSTISLPTARTIDLFYNAVTSLTSFKNEAAAWEKYVFTSIPLLFKSEAEFRDHEKVIKRAIVLGITKRFDLLNGSKLLKGHELLALSVTEAERFRRLDQKQRKAEKDKEKESARGDYKRRLAYLVDLVHKRTNSRFHRMVKKYFPKDVAQSAIVYTQEAIGPSEECDSTGEVVDSPAIQDMSVTAEFSDEDIEDSNVLGKRKRDQTNRLNPSDGLSAAGPSKKPSKKRICVDKEVLDDETSPIVSQASSGRVLLKKVLLELMTDCEDDFLVQIANVLEAFASYNKVQKKAWLHHARSFVKPE